MSSFRCFCAVATLVMAAAVEAVRFPPKEGGPLWALLLIGACSLLGMWWIIRRKNKIPPPAAPKEYTEQDYKKDLDGLNGKGSIDDLLEKWRTTPPPPPRKSAEKKGDEPAPVVDPEDVGLAALPDGLRRIEPEPLPADVDFARSMTFDPTGGTASFVLGAAVAAAAGFAGRPIMRRVSRIRIGDWVRMLASDLLYRVINREWKKDDDGEWSYLWVIRTPDESRIVVHESTLTPAEPRGRELWTQGWCPRHWPRVEDPLCVPKTFSTLEKMRCGCFTPLNGLPPDEIGRFLSRP